MSMGPNQSSGLKTVHCMKSIMCIGTKHSSGTVVCYLVLVIKTTTVLDLCMYEYVSTIQVVGLWQLLLIERAQYQGHVVVSLSLHNTLQYSACWHFGMYWLHSRLRHSAACDIHNSYFC